jgi:hypothetical protein
MWYGGCRAQTDNVIDLPCVAMAPLRGARALAYRSAISRSLRAARLARRPPATIPLHVPSRPIAIARSRAGKSCNAL